MSFRNLPFLLCALLFAGIGSSSVAGKGNGKGGGGGGGGGGGEEPPSEPDPAIVYVDSQSSELFVMDADGGNSTAIVDLSVGAWANTHPTWSADGARIVFRSGATGSLLTVNRDGTGLTEIHRGNPFFPTWSPTAAPDGSEKIAFREGEIWLINPDGTGLQQLTNTPDRVETYPAWAPDGKRIAVFYQELDTVDGTRVITGRGLMVLHLGLDTAGAIEVAAEEIVVSGGPDMLGYSWMEWARTQDKLVFSRRFPDDSRDLFVIDLVTGAETQLTFSADIDEFRSSWSPDDAHILFERTGRRARDNGLFVMNADGSGLTSLAAKSGRVANWRR